MRIGIIGTRGIPNEYGGFEQFAEYVSVRLVEKGHDVTVYNSSNHPYTDEFYKGVRIIRGYDPEHKIGTVGQFVYDFNCIVNARKQDFDVLLQLGYTSSSVWHFLLPKKKSKIVTNMDGLEWKRTKFSGKVQRFLKMAEKWAVNSSHQLVADSKGIQSYLKEKHGVASTYIAYGAENCKQPDASILDKYGVSKDKYLMLVARMEPENNIEMILDGVVIADVDIPILVVGKTENEFAKRLQSKYKDKGCIKWLGGIYNQNHLDALRWYSQLYFHGHSVGGTNPSLLEAMASNALIAAHDNEFNKGVLGSDAYYFSSAKEVSEAIAKIPENTVFGELCRAENRKKIETEFSWGKITNAYEALFRLSLSSQLE